MPICSCLTDDRDETTILPPYLTLLYHACCSEECRRVMFTRPEGASAHISSQGFAVRTPPPPGGILVAPGVLYPTTAFSGAPVNPRRGGDTSAPTTLLGGAAVPGGSRLAEGGTTSPTGLPLALRASTRWRRSLTAGRHGEISTRRIEILTDASPN